MASEQSPQPQAAPAPAESANDFEALLKKEFRPQTESVRQDIDAAVGTLAELAIKSATLVSGDGIATIQAMIAEIDRRLSDQINLIIHHPDYQKLEGAWRGIHHLVNNTETDEMLKIRVMNISKKDLHKTLKKFKGAAWDQSPLFKRLYEEEFGQLGGEPYGCLVGDYHFDHSGPDVEMLGELSKIAAAVHAPFITGASPALFQMESWRELSNPRDLTKIFQTPEDASSRSLRQAD